MAHTNIHDPLHVYSNRELPLTQLPVDNTIDTLHRTLTICMENPQIPGRIQMAPFIPVEIFRQKSNTFRGIIFFPFLPKTTEIFCIICLDYQCQASCREKVKNAPVFCKWYNSIPFLFSVPKKKNQYHLTRIFHRNFRTNGKRSQSCFFKVNLPKEDLYWPLHY